MTPRAFLDFAAAVLLTAELLVVTACVAALCAVVWLPAYGIWRVTG